MNRRDFVKAAAAVGASAALPVPACAALIPRATPPPIHPSQMVRFAMRSQTGYMKGTCSLAYFEEMFRTFETKHGYTLEHLEAISRDHPTVLQAGATGTETIAFHTGAAPRG